jgi:GNAT superfamily N-acetyltransferase
MAAGCLNGDVSAICVSPSISEVRDISDFLARLANFDDLAALRTLMERAITSLQSGFLTPSQVVASRSLMGIDTQLLTDRTYYLVERDGRIAGCGGWSFRATLFGGDDSVIDREPVQLDPLLDPARIRAMYTDPGFARQGVAALVLDLCEQAARAADFRRCELMATAGGVPFYRHAGYAAVEPIRETDVGGVKVPLLRMQKHL